MGAWLCTLIHVAVSGGHCGARPIARCHQSIFCLRSHTAHTMSAMATARSETPRMDPTVMVSCLCAEQLFGSALAIAAGLVSSPVSLVEFDGEPSWPLERPATPISGVPSNNVNVGLPSIHARLEFVSVVLASPQQYCVAVEFASHTDRRTFELRYLLPFEDMSATTQSRKSVKCLLIEGHHTYQCMFWDSWLHPRCCRCMSLAKSQRVAQSPCNIHSTSRYPRNGCSSAKVLRRHTEPQKSQSCRQDKNRGEGARM